MSNFGLFFIFAHACELQIDRKIFLCIFTLVFSSFSRNNVFKKRSVYQRFLCCSFVEGETKEAFYFDKRTLLFLQRFSHTLFLEKEEKSSEKNTEKCFRIHL